MSYPRFIPSDFSLAIRFKKPDAGSYPRVDLPGFYLHAGFANEGEADWVYSDRLLSPEALLGIARSVDNALVQGAARNYLGREDGPLTAKLRPIADAGRKQLEAQKQASEDIIKRHTETLAKIEEALKNA
jgi:hypothetical protein